MTPEELAACRAKQCRHVPGLIRRLHTEDLEEMATGHQFCNCCACAELRRRDLTDLLAMGRNLPGSR